MTMDEVKGLLKIVSGFPKPGIEFIDISPVLRHPEAFRFVVDTMIEEAPSFDKIAAIESRGFLLGAAMGISAAKGLVLMRKKGKLPGETIHVDYDLEYGTDRLEVTADAFQPDDRVLVVDDVLATGGTAHAASKLVSKAGAHVVGYSFFIEIAALFGREKLDRDAFSLIVR